MPYFSIEGYDLASIWLALDPTREHTGALKFAKGSHKWGKLYQPIKIGENKPVDSFNRDDLIATVPDIDNNPDKYPRSYLRRIPATSLSFMDLHFTPHQGTAAKIRHVGRCPCEWQATIYSGRTARTPLIFDQTLNDGEPLRMISNECPQVWPQTS